MRVDFIISLILIFTLLFYSNGCKAEKNGQFIQNEMLFHRNTNYSECENFFSFSSYFPKEVKQNLSCYLTQCLYNVFDETPIVLTDMELKYLDTIIKYIYNTEVGNEINTYDDNGRWIEMRFNLTNNIVDCNYKYEIANYLLEKYELDGLDIFFDGFTPNKLPNYIKVFEMELSDYQKASIALIFLNSNLDEEANIMLNSIEDNEIKSQVIDVLDSNIKMKNKYEFFHFFLGVEGF